MTLAPQFCASVRGMTSSALPIAAYGHLEMPVCYHSIRDSRTSRRLVREYVTVVAMLASMR